jgi:hypothetical protein
MRLRSCRFALFWGLLLALPVAPLTAGVLYDNGPINGNITAWTVAWLDEGDYKVTNSFQLSSPSIVTGIVFGAWGYPGRTGLWADWAITSTPFGAPLASGESTLSNSFLFHNSQGADVSQETFALPALSLGPGKYWLEFDDTMTTGSYWFWWDQNNGPSEAQYVGPLGSGSIGSESFQILGSPTGPGATPEPDSVLLLGSGTLLLTVALVCKRKVVLEAVDRPRNQLKHRQGT